MKRDDPLSRPSPGLTDRVEPHPAPYDRPIRVQRQRTKGWRMPENTVYVGRPTKWGNPWSVNGYYDAGYSGDLLVAVRATVEQFRAWVTRTRSSWSGDIPQEEVWMLPGVPGSGRTPPDVSALRGKNLACWCPLDRPCHADVLLKIANA